MSRCYRRVKERDGSTTWVRRLNPKPLNAKWAEARAKRAEKRKYLPQQGRNNEGFIIKQGDDGLSYLYDPGDIDRALWAGTNDLPHGAS